MANRLVLFDDPLVSSEELAAALRTAGLKVDQKGDRLTVHHEAELTIELLQAEWLKEEASALAQGHPDAERIGRCALRLELTWDDDQSAPATRVLQVLEPALRTALASMWVYDPANARFL